MTLTLLQCVKAYKAITELENQPMNFSTAHTLVMAKRNLTPHVEFYTIKEREIIEKYAIPDENGQLVKANGRFNIPTENAGKLNEDRAELNNVEVEVVINGKISNLPEVKPAVLDALLDVFEFSVE